MTDNQINREFLMALLKDSNVYSFPCSPGCTTCSELDDAVRNCSLKEFWKNVLSIVKTIGAGETCKILKKLSVVLDGSLVEFDFCMDCANPHKSGIVEGNLKVSISGIQEIINSDGLGLFESSSNCSLHNCGNSMFCGFGKVPSVCLLCVNDRVLSDSEIVMQQVIAPLRFISKSDGSYDMIFPEVESRQENFLFLPNPMLKESMKSKFLRTNILLQRRIESEHVFLISIDNVFEDRLVDWNLSDVISGKPFNRASGKVDLFNSIFFCTRAGFSDPIVLTPAPNIKKSSNGQIISVTLPQDALSYTAPMMTTATASPVASAESDNSEGEESEDHHLGDRDILEEEEEDIPTSTECYKRSLPPILGYSVSDLINLNISNVIYSTDQSNQGISVEQLNSDFLKGNLYLPGIASDEIPTLSYCKSAIYGDEVGFLELHLDVDSIDVLSKPWHLSAFQGTLFEVLPYYKSNFAAKETFLSENDNLVLQPSTMSLNFNHFTSQRGRTSILDKTPSPLAIMILRMKLSCSIRAIGIKAIVPSETVDNLTSSCFGLLKLFQKKVNGIEEEISDKSLPRICQQYSWYILSQLFIKMASYVTKKVSFPTIAFVPASTAIPTTANSHLYCRSTGRGSGSYSGPTLLQSEYLATSNLLLRFFMLLEIEIDVPENIKTFSPYEDSVTPLKESHLLSLKDAPDDVKDVLKEQGVGEKTQEFFQTKVWNGQKIGDLIKCSFLRGDLSIQERIPGLSASRKAQVDGFISLNDLLLFAPTIFRLTVHGLKYDLPSYPLAKRQISLIKKSFNFEHTWDSIIDIACTLRSPSDSKWDIYLPSCSATNPHLILPKYRSGRQPKTLNRCQLFSGMGYPHFADISTRKLNRSDEEALFRNGIRRMKCYSTSRHSMTERGLSLHETCGSKLQVRLAQSPKIFTEWAKGRRQLRTADLTTYEKNENERRSFFKKLIEDIRTRRHAHESSNTSVSVRTELTIELSGSDGVIEEEILPLLKISEHRKSLSTEAYDRILQRIDTISHGSEITDENILSNPSRWPWWTALVAIKNESINGKFISPLAIFPNAVIYGLEMNIEENLLRNAQSIYEYGKCIVSGQIIEHAPNIHLKFLGELFEKLSLPWICHIALLFSRAFLSAAKALSTNNFCEKRDFCWSIPSFLMSALGIDVSWYHYGYPAVKLSRVVLLHRVIEVAANQLSEKEDLSDIWKNLLENNGQSSLKDAATNWDELCLVPHHLCFEARVQHRKFEEWILGIPSEQRSLSVHLRDFRDEQGNSIHETHDSLSRTIRNHLDISCLTNFKKSIRELSSLFAILLVSDFYNSLQIMTVQYGLKEMDGEEEILESRQNPKLISSEIELLTRQVEDGTPWIDSRRIVSSTSLSFTDAITELRKFFCIPDSCLIRDEIEGNLESHNLLTNSDGSMNYKSFIHTMISISSTFTPNISSVVQDHNHLSFWKSIYFLFLLNGYMDLEIYEGERAGSTVHRNFLKRTYYEKFPEYMFEALMHCGFGIVCPRLESESHIALDNNSNIIPWHQTPYLSWIRNDQYADLVTMGVPESMTSSRNEKIKLLINAQSRNGFSVDITTLRHQVTKFKEKSENLKREHTRQLIENRPEQELSSTLHLLRENLKSIILQLHKSKVSTEIVLFEFDRLFQNGDFNQHSVRYFKPSRDYAARILGSLIYMRFKVGDEGFACCIKPNGKYVTLRTVSDEDLNFVRRIFDCKKSVWDKPWSREIYMHPDRTAAGGRTSKINKSIVDKILLETGLVFKTVMERDDYERKIFKHDECRGYRGWDVRKIYRNFNNRNESSILQSRSMWRLKPTALLVEGIKDYIRKKTRE